MENRKKKVLKTAIISVLAILAACILLAAVVMFWYYPHYCAEKQSIAVDLSAADEIKLMSYNVRCLTPLDLGKKSWFYRADLIVDDISQQMPGIIGFQEATKWQYAYLVESLPDYDSVITYRDESVIA